eukprot:CAMPEP_0119469728 /NCGR_PEP_ID=MMETSP1344-20130328/2918_1 /TAXON_ID=236787 /ORGANISM="Florenciella parvula, Strain CCMP2471" /LENGTH=1370 /DNA_ID=CAMNT_0007502313 /DNA_START=401 /DNA_END=4513 /DNA_ORIENTATION=+
MSVPPVVDDMLCTRPGDQMIDADLATANLPKGAPVYPLVYDGVTYGHQCGDIRLLLPLAGMYHIEFESMQIGFHVKRVEENGRVLLRVDNIFDRELYKKGVKEEDEVYAINGHLCKEDSVTTHHRFVKAIEDNPIFPMDIAFIEGAPRISLNHAAIAHAAEHHQKLVKSESIRGVTTKVHEVNTHDPLNPHHEHAVGQMISSHAFKSLDGVKGAKGALKKYLKNYEPYANFPYQHHEGSYQPYEDFDFLFIDQHNGLLVKSEKFRALERQGNELRQQLTDILYMAGVPLDEIPQMLSTTIDAKGLDGMLKERNGYQKKDIAMWKAELKKMQREADAQSDSMFKLDVEAPDRIKCTQKTRDVARYDKLYRTGKNIRKPEIHQEIEDMKAEMGALHGTEREYNADLEELRLREERMKQITPVNNAIAAWNEKESTLLLMINERNAAKLVKERLMAKAAGGGEGIDDELYDDEPVSPGHVEPEWIELPPDVPANRRLEGKDVDEFWGNTDFPWHSEAKAKDEAAKRLAAGLPPVPDFEKASNDDQDTTKPKHRPKSAMKKEPSKRSTHVRQASSRGSREMGDLANEDHNPAEAKAAEEGAGAGAVEAEVGELLHQVSEAIFGEDEVHEGLGGHHRGTSNVKEHWAEVYERDHKTGEEAKVVFADRPLLISFGDMRALRPQYFPSAGSQAAALDNAFNHIGVDTDMVVDGNDVFFEHVAAIAPQDSTKMEIIRKLIFEQLSLDPKVISKDGGDFSTIVESLTKGRGGPKGEQAINPILECFKKQSRLEGEIAVRYKLPPNNTYLFEREHSEEIQDPEEGFSHPRYVETYETWFGGMLPPLKKRHKRFGVYDVRKKAKKAAKQSLLWMGILLVRQDDVDAVQRLLINKTNWHLESTPFMSDGEAAVSEGTTASAATLSLVKIVGKEQQRRYADAFVLRDVLREGAISYDAIKDIMFSKPDVFPPGIGLRGKMTMRQLDALVAEKVPDRDPVIENITYYEYEELCMAAVELYDPNSVMGKRSNMFENARRRQILDKHRTELLNVFDRYDWDRSGDLQVKEVFGILHELQFNDVSEELVKALFQQYDSNNDGSIDQDEYLEMVVDALMTLDGSEVTFIDSAFKFMTNTNPSLTHTVERKVQRRVALYFEESDGADNMLTSLDLSPLGELDVVNGFEIMCKAGDFKMSRKERDEFFNDQFRMELVLNCFVKAFVAIEPYGNSFKYLEDGNASLQSMLSDGGLTSMLGGKTGALTKEAFLGALKEWKDREKNLKDACREAVGTTELLTRLDGNVKAWESASLHLTYLDMIEVDMEPGYNNINNPTSTKVYPSPKRSSRYDVYTCREDGTIRWIIVVLNDDADINYITEHYGHHNIGSTR